MQYFPRVCGRKACVFGVGFLSLPQDIFQQIILDYYSNICTKKVGKARADN